MVYGHGCEATDLPKDLHKERRRRSPCRRDKVQGLGCGLEGLVFYCGFPKP